MLFELWLVIFWSCFFSNVYFLDNPKIIAFPQKKNNAKGILAEELSDIPGAGGATRSAISIFEVVNTPYTLELPPTQ